MKCTAAQGLCEHPVWEDGLCRGHYARRRRGQSLSTPLRGWRNEKRALFEAALALGFVDGDEAEFLRVIRRFWAAHKRAALVFRNKVHPRTQSDVHDREHRKTARRPR